MVTGAQTVEFVLDGRAVSVADEAITLLEALRERLGRRLTVKDGCAPQGQCGCCTVWVDGMARAACVTPLRRVAGRQVTLLEGLPGDEREAWTGAFLAAGASQCGFCTPGIVMRLAALLRKKPDAGDAEVDAALAAHLCRCTGWQPIRDAVRLRRTGAAGAGRDLDAATRRAALEGGTHQAVGRDVVAGGGGFADDDAPGGALVAVPVAGSGGGRGYAVAGTLAAARAAAGKVQGRNSSLAPVHPLAVPPGAWDLRLATTFVEPAYLEPDASWCEPGGEPADPLGNGGAFGAKGCSAAPGDARRLAGEHGRPVRVVYSREDVVRLGPKRPPIAAGIRLDGTGVVRVGRTPGSRRPADPAGPGGPGELDLDAWAAAWGAALPGVEVEVVDIPGPPVSASLRGAGWVEAAVLAAVLERRRAAGGPTADTGWATVPVPVPPVTVVAPGGGRATVAVEPGPPEIVRVEVDAGAVLDEVVLRSYCCGAVHQALSWVRSEALALDEGGRPVDLTIRSFGVLPARRTPVIEVDVVGVAGAGAAVPPPCNGSDAVLAAAAAAAWLAAGLPERWPAALAR